MILGEGGKGSVAKASRNVEMFLVSIILRYIN